MSPSPAGWYPDPERGHEYRYYDGSLWTAHVADQGQVAHAPIGAPGLRTRAEDPVYPVHPVHTPLGGLRPGGWLPLVPRFKMWALVVLSPFIFWITLNGHRLVVPIGIACALWCWHTTNDVYVAHRRASSPAVSEIRTARYLALALAAFCLVQFVVFVR
jgi:hypothetical protein